MSEPDKAIQREVPAGAGDALAAGAQEWPWLYALGRFLLWAFLKLWHRTRFVGGENMPAEGAVLVVSNHCSDLDPPALGSAVRRHVAFLAKTELFKLPFLSWALPRVGAVPINRGAGDRAAIRRCIEVLQQGRPLVIFPEGTRSRDGRLQEPQLGVSMIISQMPDVTILPVRVEGSFDAWGPGKKYPRPVKITVTVGKPFKMSEMNNLPTVKKQLYHALGAEIMKRISAASP
jgi:1-acyl-sn-glycerol-3-phosphate acyltransferase